MAQKTQTKVDAVVVLVDAKLTHHLKMAEEHLIEAVKLFEREHKPQRHHDYITRLTRAQEMVTGLLREELIRIRGPIKITAKVSKRKK
jgi:transcription termination factor Rho